MLKTAYWYIRIRQSCSIESHTQLSVEVRWRSTLEKQWSIHGEPRGSLFLRLFAPHEVDFPLYKLLKKLVVGMKNSQKYRKSEHCCCNQLISFVYLYIFLLNVNIHATKLLK